MAARRRSKSRKKLSRKDLAALEGVTQSTVSKWVKAGCPQNADGTMDADAVHEWRQSKKSPGSTAKALEPRSTTDPNRIGDVPEDAIDDKVKAVKWGAEYRKQKAIEQQLRVRKMLGELIELADHKRILVARAATFRQKLMALPKRMAHQLHGLTPQQIHERMDLECRDILKSIIEAPTIEDEEDGDEAA